MHVFCTTFLQLGNFKKKHSAWPRPHPDVPSGAYAVGGPLHPESAAARWVERRCWFEILFEIGLHVPEWSRMAWREPVQTLAVTEFACCMLHDILLPMIFFGWPTNFTIVSDGADVQPKQWQSWSVLLRLAGKQLHWPPGQVSFFLDMRCEVHVSMTFSQISRLREPRDAYKDQTRPNPAERKSWWTWGRCCAFGWSKLTGMETLNHGTKWIFEHFILRATQRVASTCSSHPERSRWTPEKVDGHGWQLLLFPFLIAFCRCLALKWLGIDVIGW